jgi:uncharacterized protein
LPTLEEIACAYQLRMHSRVDWWKMEFEWDFAKALSNLEKHGIAFEDACSIFEGVYIMVPSRYADEDRKICIGVVCDRCVSVVITFRDDRIRIISARVARSHERQAYWTRFPAAET